MTRDAGKWSPGLARRCDFLAPIELAFVERPHSYMSTKGEQIMALGKNVAANYLGQGWAAVMALAFIPFYIRYLGIEAFGLIGLLALVQAWLTLLDMGMTPTLSREMARFTGGAHSPQAINDLVRSVEVICALIAVGAGLTLWAASDWLALHWIRASVVPTATVQHAIAVMAIVAAMRFPESIYRSALIGLQRQVWYNAANALVATLRGVGAVLVLAFVSPSIEAFFQWQVLMSGLAVVVLGYGVHKHLPAPPGPRRFSASSIMDIWKFAAGMVGITGLALMLTQVDKLLLSRLLSLEEFGVYTIAATVSGAIFMVIAPLTTAYYPRMVELANDPQSTQLARAYHQGAQAVNVATSPVALTLACFSGGAMFAWSGDAQLASRVEPILSLLVLGTFINGLMQMPYHLQLAFGWTSLTIKANVIAVAVLIPILLWAVPRFGAVAAAGVWLTLNTAYMIGMAQALHRRLLRAEKWRWYFDDVGLPVVAVLISIGLAAMFRPGPDHGRWYWLGFLAATTVLAYGCAATAASTIRPRLFAGLRMFFTAAPKKT